MLIVYSCQTPAFSLLPYCTFTNFYSIDMISLVVVVTLYCFGREGDGPVRVVYQVGLHVGNLVVPHFEVLHSA
jgi:hypothetical protein